MNEADHKPGNELGEELNGVTHFVTDTILNPLKISEKDLYNSEGSDKSLHVSHYNASFQFNIPITYFFMCHMCNIT